MRNTSLFFIGMSLLAACSQSSSTETASTGEAHVYVTDSIQVDYLGSLHLLDYEPGSKLYLGADNRTEELLLFDDSGEIVHQFTLQTDGPNAITSSRGTGFFEGHITVMDYNKGIIVFSNEGNILKRIPMPADYFILSGLSSPPFFRLGDELAYLRPERESFNWNDQAELFERVYRSPLIEVLDTKNGTIRQTMPFPPETVYEDGNYYHLMFPLIATSEREWVVALMAERKYHVYRDEEGELVYSQTVDLGIEDAINIKGVPLANIQDMQEMSRFNIFGRIEQIYFRDEDIVVVYTKGVPEDIVRQHDPDDSESWMELIRSRPLYMAVLNHSHVMIKKDIPIPPGMWPSPVSNGKGEILAIKIQEYFGVEEDFVTIYRLDVSY